jgi:hypothetical protein
MVEKLIKETYMLVKEVVNRNQKSVTVVGKAPKVAEPVVAEPVVVVEPVIVTPIVEPKTVKAVKQPKE